MKPTLLASALAATFCLATSPALFAQDDAENGAATEAAADATDESAEAPAAEAVDVDTFSYALGLLMGESVKNFNELNYDRLFSALQTQHEGGEADMSLMEAQQVMQQYQMAMAEAAAAEAKTRGDAYLAENKARDGVQETDSGLQYEVLTEGDGEKPTAEDVVKVHYVGTLLDGTEFDSSVARGEPAQFPLKGVIPGWTEGLQLMPVGSKYRFVIPADLAYGERGAGQAIGPGETLVFEVELLEIVDEKGD